MTTKFNFSGNINEMDEFFKTSLQFSWTLKGSAMATLQQEATRHWHRCQRGVFLGPSPPAFSTSQPNPTILLGLTGVPGADLEEERLHSGNLWKLS